MVAFYKLLEPPRQGFQVWLSLSDSYNAQNLASLLSGLHSRKPKKCSKILNVDPSFSSLDTALTSELLAAESDGLS